MNRKVKIKKYNIIVIKLMMKEQDVLYVKMNIIRLKMEFVLIKLNVKKKKMKNVLNVMKEAMIIGICV